MNLWEQLLETLEKQTEVYVELGLLLESQQKAIIDDNLTELEEVTIKQSGLARYLSDLEKKRIEVLNQVADNLGLNPEVLTIKVLVEYLPEKYRKFYDSVVIQLKDSLKRTQMLNKQNKDLLEVSLIYINYSLSLLAGAHSSSGYGQSGQEQEVGNAKKISFDYKA